MADLHAVIVELVEPLHAAVSEIRQKLERKESNRSSFEISLSYIPPEVQEKVKAVPGVEDATVASSTMWSSKTMGDAWRRAARYTTVVNEGLSLRFVDGRDIRMIFEPVGVPRHIDRHQIECGMTALMRVCRQLTGRELTASRVEFTHRRNDDPSELSAFFGCDVRFGAPADQATFAATFKELPIASADPHLNELLIAHGEEALARRTANRGSFRSQVENAMLPLLPHGMVRAGEIAKDLGVSQRTLARRLAVEGATFSDVLEGLRSDLARQYLADAGLTVSQVAWLLGYQEISAFTHAFKRWTGMTPREARAMREAVAS